MHGFLANDVHIYNIIYNFIVIYSCLSMYTDQVTIMIATFDYSYEIRGFHGDKVMAKSMYPMVCMHACS